MHLQMVQFPATHVSLDYFSGECETLVFRTLSWFQGDSGRVSGFAV